MPREYEFTRVTRTDYPMLAKWLAEPHMGGWWGTPEEEIALIEEEIDRMEEDEAPSDMRIVSLDGQAFAFLQDYPIHLHPDTHWGDQPRGTRSVDTFLGDPAYLGQKHAQAYIRQRASDLLAGGVPKVIADPVAGNTRAIATYRAAGFDGPDTPRRCKDGTECLILTFTPSSW